MRRRPIGPGDRPISRRAFCKELGLGTIGLGFGVSVLDGIYRYAGALGEEDAHVFLTRGTLNFKGTVAKEITPSNEFYTTTYSENIPDIDPRAFLLRIEGLAQKPYTLSLGELQEMKDKVELVTLECIGNPAGGEAIGNALWDGVTLKKIIERAEPRKGVVKVVFHAADGYSDSIPYSLALSGDVFLAFGMNGMLLPKEHGYPLRAVVPGLYGMKHVKWLSKIELVNYDFRGYWEKRGWSDTAVIPIKSQILLPTEGRKLRPGNYLIGGVAFAGRHGISKVQVSLDGRKTWHDAEIRKPLSRWSWVLWRYPWRPSHEGEYVITVRGFDAAGKVQDSAPLLGRPLSTFPDGAKELHAVNVKVTR